MQTSLFHPQTVDDLPAHLAIFPLSGAVVLPYGLLPLNIFEPRYLAMVEDALATSRMIGMIQPQPNDSLYQTGCAGRIVSFEETEDDRFLIVLKGVCRFKITREVPNEESGEKPYRIAQLDWQDYALDVQPLPQLHDQLRFDMGAFIPLLKQYLDQQDLGADWEQLQQASPLRLLHALIAAGSFTIAEKQALIEAKTPQQQLEILQTMLHMAVLTDDGESQMVN